MGQYTNEALAYSNRVSALKTELNDVIIELKKITPSFGIPVPNDVLTTNTIAGNNEIIEAINKVIGIFDTSVQSLQKKAKEIDDRIELQKLREQEELSKLKGDSSMLEQQGDGR